MHPDEAKKEAKKISDWIIDIRRELHKHPELMYEEIKTSALVRRESDKLGIEYKSPIAKTGVLASLGNGNGPCVPSEQIWMPYLYMKRLMSLLGVKLMVKCTHVGMIVTLPCFWVQQKY